MIKKKIKQIFFIGLCLFLGTNTAFAASVNTIENRVAGDDPGVTITSPEKIISQEQVVLDVTLSTSAGKLDEDGMIQVTIPKEIVRSKGDLTNNLALGDPFFLKDPAVTENENGDYVLNIGYDHTKIDQESAQGYTFSIKFGAPYIEASQEFPDEIDFGVELTKGQEVVSTDSDSSKINKVVAGLPLLSKYSSRPTATVNGKKAALMSLEKPSDNVFIIIVNYKGGTYENAKIKDKMPEGTKLTDPRIHIPATGDATIYQHFRIAKVTGYNDTGKPDAWEYVTSQFADKITATDTDFEIDFGNIQKDDKYVVMYAAEITGKPAPTPQEFGVRTNNVDLLSNDTVVASSNTNIALDKNEFTSVKLNKTVDVKDLSTTESSINYNLVLSSASGVVEKGTIIKDKLPEFTTFIKTNTLDNEYISEVGYDEATNTISYILEKDLPVNIETKINFEVSYQNINAKPNDQIVNKASFVHHGSEIFSNDATTTQQDSAILFKSDSDTKNPLEGAVFKLVDSKGQIIATDLTSDSEGLVHTGILKPGNYQLIETKAPDGYELETTPIDFIIVKGQQTTISLSKTNQLKPTETETTETETTETESTESETESTESETESTESETESTESETESTESETESTESETKSTESETESTESETESTESETESTESETESTESETESTESETESTESETESTESETESTESETESTESETESTESETESTESETESTESETESTESETESTESETESTESETESTESETESTESETESTESETESTESETESTESETESETESTESETESTESETETTESETELAVSKTEPTELESGLKQSNKNSKEKLPQTGEQKMVGVTVLGAIILVSAAYIIYKRKK